MRWPGGGGEVRQGGQWEGSLFNRGNQEGLMLSPQSKFDSFILHLLSVMDDTTCYTVV